jgi:hypothetical protein
MLGSRGTYLGFASQSRAASALAGRRLGRGVPAGHAGKKTSASFLCNGTRSLSENAGFSYERHAGNNHCVMSETVPPGYHQDGDSGPP